MTRSVRLLTSWAGPVVRGSSTSSMGRPPAGRDTIRGPAMSTRSGAMSSWMPVPCRRQASERRDSDWNRPWPVTAMASTSIESRSATSWSGSPRTGGQRRSVGGPRPTAPPGTYAPITW